jgi:hypothetical protein
MATNPFDDIPVEEAPATAVAEPNPFDSIPIAAEAQANPFDSIPTEEAIKPESARKVGGMNALGVNAPIPDSTERKAAVSQAWNEGMKLPEIAPDLDTFRHLALDPFSQNYDDTEKYIRQQPAGAPEKLAVGGLKGVNELANGIAGFFTSGSGLTQLGLAATPLAPAVYAKWAYDMAKGAIESGKKSIEDFNQSDWENLGKDLVTTAGLGFGAKGAVGHGLGKAIKTAEGFAPMGIGEVAKPKVAISPPADAADNRFPMDVAAFNRTSQLGGEFAKTHPGAEPLPPIESVALDPATGNPVPSPAQALMDKMNQRAGEIQAQGAAKPAPVVEAAKPVEVAKPKSALPEVRKGDKRIQIIQPDGTIVEGVTNGKNWDLGKGPILNVGRAVEGKWSDGPLRPGEKVHTIEGSEMAPKPDWKVSVQPIEGDIPGWVQIVDPRGKETDQSPTVESLRAAGHDVPDFSKLPKGTYTFEEAVKLAKDSEKPQGAGEPPADVNIPPVVGEQPAVPAAQVLELAKANPDGVDVTHLTKPERRTLARQGLRIFQQPDGKVIARYQQKPQPKAEIAPAPVVSKPLRMAEVPDASTLVWYKTNPKYLPTITKRLERKGLAGKYVLDSISEDGRIAFTEGIDANLAELLRLKAETIPKVKGENLFSIRNQFTDLMQEFGERMGHIRDINRYSAGLVAETGVNQGTIGIRGRIENSRAVKAAHESILKSLGLDPSDKSLQAFAKALPLLKAEVAKFKVMDENFLTRDDFTKTRITADDLQPGDTITSNGVTLKVVRRNSEGTVQVSSTETGEQFFTKGQEIWVDDAELQTKPKFSPELVDESEPVEPEAPAAEFQGMGAAVPGEFQPGQGTATSIKNATVDAERAKRGLPPAMEPARRTFQDVWDAVMAKLDREPDWLDGVHDSKGRVVKEGLLAELRRKPRALTDMEDAALLHRQIDLQNEYAKATRDLAQAHADGRFDAVAEEKIRTARYRDQLYDLYEINKKVGTETGRGLNARKMMAYEDFSLAKMEMEKRAIANNGAPLTEKQAAEIAELHQRIAETQKRFDDYVKDAEAKESGRLAKEALEQIERERNKPKASDYVISVAEKWVKEWDKSGEAAKLRLMKRLGRTNVGIDPTILSDLAIVGRSYLGHIGLDVAKFGQKMVAQFGDFVAPHIQEIFDAARALVEKTNLPPEVKKKILTKVKDMTPEQRKTRLVEKLQDKFDQDKRNEITGIVQKIAREVVEDGARGWEAILDGVHAIIQGIDPEFTRRETMDAISGYGKYKRLSMDEISVALREGKGEMQQVAKIEDITSGVSPKPSGIERRSPSELEREKIKLVNELKKKHPELFEGSGLKSSLESRKTYYRNRISDLRSEIVAREKLIKEKTLPPTDAELEAIKAEYEIVKAEHAAMFKEGISDAQRIKLMLASIERQMAEYGRRISEKDFSKKQPSKLGETPEVKSAQAELDALREEYKALRDLDPEWQSEQSVKKLEQDKASLERTIAEQERKLRENDLATKKQPVNRPAVDGLEQLKQKRDFLNRQIAEARKPKRSAADIALQQFKARTAARIAEYERRVLEKDYAPKVRKTVQLDTEALKLKAQAEEAKQAYLKSLTLDEMAKRTTAEKVQDTLVKWRRGFVLSGFTTLGKLTSAAIQRVGFSAVEEGIGAVASKLPGVSRVAKLAPREGGFSVRAEAKAITEGLTTGMADSWKTLKTGRSDLDTLYGKPQIVPHTAIDFFGHLHGMLKAPVKRAEFARSLQKRMEHAIANGVDVTDPLVQVRLSMEAYKDANRSIFMQDNRVVSAYKRAMSKFEEKQKHTGRVSGTDKAISTTAKVLLPIVKIPTNIVAEAFQYATGSVTGSVRLAHAIAKGVDKLSPEQADHIMRSLKKGSIGAAVLLLGFYNSENVGGYYQPGQKRKKDEVGYGALQIYGVNIPKIFVHNPLLEMLQLGATVRRVMDSKMKKSDKDSQGLIEGIKAGTLVLIEEVPFVRQMIETSKLFHPRERNEFLDALTKGILIPSGMSQIAEFFDKDAAGNRIKRAPHSLVEHLKSGIPGLRQTVPVKK